MSDTNGNGTNGFIIERGVPLVGRRSKRHSYPFQDMAIGDSFSFGTDSKTLVASARTIVSRDFGPHCTDPRKFVFRKDDTGNYRCWRIA